MQRQSLQSSSLLSRNEGVEHLLRPQQRESTSLDQEIQIHEDWWAKQRQSTSLDQEIQTHEDWWAKQQRESSEQGSWRPQKQTRRTGDVPWKLPRLPFMGSTSTTDIEAKSQLDPKDTRAQLPPKTSLTTAQTVSPPVASAVKRWSQVVASFWPYMNSWYVSHSGSQSTWMMLIPERFAVISACIKLIYGKGSSEFFRRLPGVLYGCPSSFGIGFEDIIDWLNASFPASIRWRPHRAVDRRWIYGPRARTRDFPLRLRVVHD